MDEISLELMYRSTVCQYEMTSEKVIITVVTGVLLNVLAWRGPAGVRSCGVSVPWSRLGSILLQSGQLVSEGSIEVKLGQG